jgi:hypothetical protein
MGYKHPKDKNLAARNLKKLVIERNNNGGSFKKQFYKN